MTKRCWRWVLLLLLLSASSVVSASVKMNQSVTWLAPPPHLLLCSIFASVLFLFFTVVDSWTGCSLPAFPRPSDDGLYTEPICQHAHSMPDGAIQDPYSHMFPGESPLWFPSNAHGNTGRVHGLRVGSSNGGASFIKSLNFLSKLESMFGPSQFDHLLSLTIQEMWHISSR